MEEREMLFFEVDFFSSIRKYAIQFFYLYKIINLRSFIVIIESI